MILKDDFGLAAPLAFPVPTVKGWIYYRSELGGGWRAFFNGELSKEVSMPAAGKFSGKFSLGQEKFKGGIREVIVFRDSLTEKDRDRLSLRASYLRSEGMDEPVGVMVDGQTGATPKTEVGAGGTPGAKSGAPQEKGSLAEDKVIFVDNRNGDDLMDGKAMVRSGGKGPKRTLQAIIPLLREGLEVRLTESPIPYVLPDFSSSVQTNITITPVGNVILQSENQKP
jgi:hypothetical protein